MALEYPWHDPTDGRIGIHDIIILAYARNNDGGGNVMSSLLHHRGKDDYFYTGCDSAYRAIARLYGEMDYSYDERDTRYYGVRRERRGALIRKRRAGFILHWGFIKVTRETTLSEQHFYPRLRGCFRSLLGVSRLCRAPLSHSAR